MSSNNKTIFDVAGGGNLILKPPLEAIWIIKNMSFNPYNNSRDERILRRQVNQVETDASSKDIG